MTAEARTHQRQEGTKNFHGSPNGWRLSGEGGEADRVRCSRGLGRIDSEPSLSETVTTITEGMASSLPRHDRRLGAGAQVVPFPKRAVCLDPKDFDPFGT